MALKIIEILLIQIILVSVLASPVSSQEDIFKLQKEIAMNFNFNLPQNLSEKCHEVNVTIFLVYGSNMNLIEQNILDSMEHGGINVEPRANTSEYSGFNVSVDMNMVKLPDEESTLEKILNEKSLVILIGGSKSNRISAELKKRNCFFNTTKLFWDQITMTKGVTENGSQIIMLSHERVGPERPAIKYSPLIGIIPEPYIPLAATGIGVFLMYVANILQMFIESITLEFGKKKFKFKYHKVRNLNTRLVEFLSLTGAAIVLGFAVTWTFVGPSIEFVDKLVLNSFICFLSGLSHELVHRIIGKILGIKLEYQFWTIGALITLITGYLGNAFGLQGILVDLRDENIAKWRYALMSLSGPLFSVALSLISAFIYLRYWPDEIMQTTYVVSSILALGEMVPVDPMDGYEIRKWNRFIWMIFFTIASAVFVYVNFIL